MITVNYGEFQKRLAEEEKNLKILEETSVVDIDGVEKKIKDYITDKRAILFVNTASECGLTDSNYKQLVELYSNYKDRGLEILGFPCNQFGSQESKCELDIKKFTSEKFTVTFPLFSKIEVNGTNSHPVYTYLKSNLSEFKNPDGTLNDITWNFGKFLVDGIGRVVKYYQPVEEPSAIIPEIEKLVIKN